MNPIDEAKKAAQETYDYVKGVSDKADAKADEALDKVQESRFTWAILGGAGLVILAIVVLLAAY